MKYKILTVFLFIFFVQACSKDNIDENAENNVLNISSNQKTLGTSSKDILSADRFTKMIIEIAYVEGFKPTQTTINNFVSFVEARTNKPGGIFVETIAIPSPGKSQYSIDDIIEIEDNSRVFYNTDDTITIWAFFSDGESNDNSDTSVILGKAYRNTSFVIFEDTIQGYSDSIFEPSRNVLETTIMTHEFGHILGLVNLGAPLQSNHEDTENAKHCNVNTCLMYFSTEIRNISGQMPGGTVPQLDSQCIADLQANGGK